MTVVQQVGRGRVRTPTQRDRQLTRAASRRQRLEARLTSTGGLLLAAGAPVLLWHQMIVDTAAEFRFDLAYLVSQWTPWALIAAGVVFYVPVAVSAGSHPESRWYPRARRAYAGWGVTLYLLGLLLAVQVAQLYGLQAG